ncbi:hypothetical protein KI387_020725, partial [Taxus chinensis]
YIFFVRICTGKASWSACEAIGEFVDNVIELNNNQLSGTVPLEFGKLVHLEWLNLWDNQLVSGSSELSIVAALTNCSSLRKINLSQNYLIGIPPSSVGQLSSNLFYLGLGFNKIEGNIPSDVGNLKKLTVLYLSENHFSGPIPSALGHLPNLERLHLDKNNLNGAIPRSLEYGTGGRLSKKGDVYTYGILLLEFLTRRRPTNEIFVDEINLQKWVGMDFPCKIVEVIDNYFFRDANESEISMTLACITQFIQVGLVSTNEMPQQRPTMMEKLIMPTLSDHSFGCLQQRNFEESSGFKVHIADFGITKLLFRKCMDSLTSTNALKGYASYIPSGIVITFLVDVDKGCAQSRHTICFDGQNCELYFVSKYFHHQYTLRMHSHSTNSIDFVTVEAF